MLKKWMVYTLVGALIFSFSACRGNKTEEAPESETKTAAQSAVSLQASDQSEFLWQITVEDALISEGLHTVTPVTQYDGSIVNINYDQVPEAGNCYMLLNLTVKKSSAGNSVFSWKDIILEDAEGNTYSRHENDAFLSDHGYKRMAGTDLKLGTSEGWACFEIPKSAADQTFTLLHRAKEGENEIPIHKEY